MIILYNLAIFFFRLGAGIAGFVNPKAHAFVSGRKVLFKQLHEALHANSSPLIWFHCASLGEFEQGRPIIELIKKEYPAHKLLLTFFSPSGYEIRKNYALADYVFYLPYDTASSARKFISLSKPVLVVFVKYEFWFHFTTEVRKKNIPLLSISSIFRSDQIFFSAYGNFFRTILQNFSHFFVQNDESLKLLKSIGITQCTRAGDTRFDRVMAISHQQISLTTVEHFKNNVQTWVIGSSWPEDLDVLLPFINENEGKLKFIIAPHEISESTLSEIEKGLEVKSVRYSLAGEDSGEKTVLLIDNIGMLSKLYRFGEFAFVGGAFGKGLHNILEAACYGIPVFFGNTNYEKFQEAKDLMMRGGAFEVSDYADFKKKYELLISRPENYLLACEVTTQYVQENLGATEMILQFCRKILNKQYA
ncbi:MAG: 3-deoxy-D-manno-octulosonic acid transferase [Cyclobacteriaceae bacterium]|nr:3-deoxy-D-manno-octulosonic acid transferase [Cyclobacteriaceae bacterium]